MDDDSGFDMSQWSSMDSLGGDGLLSLKEFLMTNQSSVVQLQKHLVMSAAKNRDNLATQKISAARVGPMGILSETFGD